MKQIILNTIDDLLADFFYYDRKEDDELPRGAIEKAVRDGEITQGEILDRFITGIAQSLAEETE